MPEVKILAEEEVITYPNMDKPVVMRMIRYQVGEAPARVIIVPREEFLQKGITTLIREDMPKAKTEGPRTITI